MMTLVGGIWALLWGLALAASCVLLAWPGTYYSFVLGVMRDRPGVRPAGQRRTQPEVIAASHRNYADNQRILSLDVINLTLGIITLVFLGDREVKGYFRR